MSNPYIGEIRMFAGTFAPAGWALCDGQSMPIADNDALFTLIGTTYGGDGQETFNLPNLQSRVPMHMGNGVVLAEAAGVGVSDADRHPDPDPQSSAAGVDGPGQLDRRRRTLVLAQDNIAGADLYIEDTPTANMAATAIVPGRRLAAAREHAAVPGHQFHHLAVRPLPVPDLRCTMSDPFVAEIRIFPFNFAPKGGRSATGSSSRSRRTPRSSRCWGPSTAGTASRPSHCPTCRARSPCTPARARACRNASSGSSPGRSS